jgi:hypothetical protein
VFFPLYCINNTCTIPNKGSIFSLVLLLSEGAVGGGEEAGPPFLNALYLFLGDRQLSLSVSLYLSLSLSHTHTQGILSFILGVYYCKDLHGSQAALLDRPSSFTRNHDTPWLSSGTCCCIALG